MRVFTRLDETTRSFLALNFESRLTQSSSQITRRITTERRRNEDFRRSLTSRDYRSYESRTNIRPAETAVVASARTSKASLASPAHHSQTGETWPVDIERLTEQVVRSIDSRIVAHRERTGQLF
jgi:hypothetical protein